MSDSFVLPGLRNRILPAAPSVRVLRMRGPADLRPLMTATVAAAAIAGAVTWMQSAYRPARLESGAPATHSAAADQMPTPPQATSTYGKTSAQIDRLAGLRSDPTLHLDTQWVWSPAGGLAILAAPSAAPNDGLAALPMPAPIVATPNAPQPATAEADDVPLPRANPIDIAATPVRPKQPAPAATAAAPAPSSPVESKPPADGFFAALGRLFMPRENPLAKAVLASNPRTAIYDISAHTVYLPNGETLEAHSGLGQWLDDPESYSRKNRGVTPPNTYKISLREKPFHGVQALRLTPVGEANMYGRDGMLAHTYMLGPNGQSNGCVSFKDYDKFLQAFTSGTIERLIVVPRLTPTAVAQAG